MKVVRSRDAIYRLYGPVQTCSLAVLLPIQSKENVYWTEFAISHESVSKNVSAFAEITFETFWSIISEYPDLVLKRNLQLRLMGNLGLQSGIPPAYQK